MAITSALVTATVSNSDATKDFTSSGFGTPDLAIITVVDDSQPTDSFAQMGVTLYDGTRTRTVSLRDSDSVSTTDAYTRASNSDTILFQSSSVLARHTPSFITNGLRLTRVSNNYGSIRVFVTLIKGLSNVRVDTITPNVTSGNSVATTDPGFQPDAIIFIGCNNTFQSGFGSARVHANISMGFATNREGSIQQAGMTWASMNGQSTSDVRAELKSDRICGREFYSDTIQEIEVTAFGASGFTVTSRATVSTSQDRGYAAIKFDTGDGAEIKTAAIPASTGAANVTGLSVAPELVLAASGLCSALDTEETSGVDCETFTFSQFNDTDEYTQGVSSEDNIGTTVSQCMSGSYAHMTYSGTPALQNRASLTSLNSDGWTWNFDTVNAASRYYTALAMGADSGTGRVYDFMPFMPI